MNRRAKITIVIGIAMTVQKSILKLKEKSLIGTPSQWPPVTTSPN